MSQCMCGGCERCQGALQPDLDICPLCELSEPECRCFDNRAVSLSPEALRQQIEADIDAKYKQLIAQLRWGAWAPVADLSEDVEF